MSLASRPWWQQATALVSLSASGTVTGLHLAPHQPDLQSPTAADIRLLAFRHAGRPARPGDSALRSAIVEAATHYLRMAMDMPPEQMQALIWQHVSPDGADHGPSCAAFASLTLEMGSRVVGRASWVTGGSSYPWPLHRWADGRVDPNAASPGIVSLLQDAEAHGRWHPLGDGYTPLPGDWVLFDGHVEVVTHYSGGVLRTIGGDSLPNFSVNAHEYTGSLAADGVAGFVNNGDVLTPAARPASHTGTAPATHAVPAVASSGGAAIPGAAQLESAAAEPGSSGHGAAGSAEVPAAPAPSPGPRHRHMAHAPGLRGTRPALAHRHVPGARRTATRTAIRDEANADVPGAAVRFGPAATFQSAAKGSAAIPAVPGRFHRESGRPAATGPVEPVAAAPAAPMTSAQRRFIEQIVPGAIEAQQRYGVPAAVTIAQAIDESGWGQSLLATRDHNLFGIKGAGPGGSDTQLTQEYMNGQWVVTSAPFRVYENVAQSIADHGRLLATGGYYAEAMANRHDPDAFASALTGVYATDPDYGQTLVGLMRQYGLYRYDDPTAAVPAARGASSPARAPSPSPGSTAPTIPASTTPTDPASTTPAAPGRTAPAIPASTTPVAPDGTAPAVPPSTGPVAPSGLSPTTSGGTAPANPEGARTTIPAATPTASRGTSPGDDSPATSAPGATAPPAAPAERSPTSLRPASGSVATATLTADWRPAADSPSTPPSVARPASGSRVPYEQPLPRPVRNSFAALARAPLLRAEPLYRDVAGHVGIRWELLAACDWMQCAAKPRLSPVHGEKLGTQNDDGQVYRTKSAALEQCADDLLTLAAAVYLVDLTSGDPLSIRDLANAFAAFRWGELLKRHHTSALEFPYSVAGLTVQHVSMRWPNISEPGAPDKPGTRFRMPFGAVPVVLSLNYPATA